MGLKPRPMEESNFHRPRPLGEVRRPSGPSLWGFWAAGRMAREGPPHHGTILPARNWKRTSGWGWISVKGVHSTPSTVQPDCARTPATVTGTWQQGAKCSVRGGDAEITRSGRRAGIFDVRLFASKVDSRQSLHSAHPPSIGRWLFYMRWGAQCVTGGCGAV